MLLHYLEKLKIQIFCRCSADMEENANLSCIFVASSFVIDPQISIFLEFNIASFSLLIANKIFHVTLLLFIYSCDQFVASEIRHSRRHCSVCQWSTWYSVTRTRLWQKHMNRHSIHSYTWRGIKNAICLHFFPYLVLSLNIIIIHLLRRSSHKDINTHTHTNTIIQNSYTKIERLTRAHQEMRYPNVSWRDVSPSLFTYLPLNYNRLVGLLPEYF